MDEQDLLKRIAPCGLVCYTCTGAREGAISTRARELLRLLEGFEHYAPAFAEFEPELKHYAEFHEVLASFAKAGCDGCRTGQCIYPNCPIAPCIKEKGFHFCYECGEFPCAKMLADEHLGPIWKRANRRLKRIGVESYWDEVKDRPHYA